LIGGAGVDGEDESWDFGTGAGFYIDATEPRWKDHYKMYTYVTEELPELVFKEYPIDSSRMSITGHSMGTDLL
jgi:S-formylglutathione hydrolase